MGHPSESNHLSEWLGARVPYVAVLGWLLAFVAFVWVRIKLENVEPAPSLHDALDIFTAAELFCIVMLARLFLRQPPAQTLSILEAAATVAGAAAITLIVDTKPIFAMALLTSYVLIRFAPNGANRAIAIALFAFAAQYWMQAGPFIWLHEMVGIVDADVLRRALAIAGHEIGGTGTTIMRIDRSFGVDIAIGCASSFVVAIVAPIFAIALLGLRGAFRPSDLRFFAGLIAATVLLNWIRLYPTSLSHDGWLYWHEGDGASLIAAANGLLIAAFVYLALHHVERRPVAAV